MNCIMDITSKNLHEKEFICIWRKILKTYQCRKTYRNFLWTKIYKFSFSRISLKYSEKLFFRIPLIGCFMQPQMFGVKGLIWINSITWLIFEVFFVSLWLKERLRNTWLHSFRLPLREFTIAWETLRT